MAKSILAFIPVYQMQVMHFPNRVCKDINRLTRRFIWNDNLGNRSFNLVNWRTFIIPKYNRGLGLKDAHYTNWALLGNLAGN